ncbi:MAG: hypothetical protein P8046_11810 [Anaerolineales bacterium]
MKKIHLQEPKYWIIAIEVAVLLLIGTIFFPGGADLRNYYLPFVNGCMDCGFVPYYGQWMLFPLTLVPETWAWTLWTFVSMVGFLLLSRITEVNPAYVMLSFPLFGQFWLGQVDLIICVGLVLAIYSPKAFLRGLGICLMLLKPQISILPILFLIIREDEKNWWKVIIFPVAMLLISFLVYGVVWPFAWLQNASAEIPSHVWKLAAGLFWPWGLMMFPLVFLFKQKREGTLVALLISAVVMPYFSVYSYVVFLILESSIGTVVISFLWLISMPFMGREAMKFSWILPLYLLMIKFKERFMEGKLSTT